MDRRKVLGYISAIGILGFYGNRSLTPVNTKTAISHQHSNKPNEITATNSTLELHENTILSEKQIQLADNSVVDYLYKIKHFENDFNSDIFLGKEEYFVLKRLSRRLNRAQTIIGFLNFSILDFPMLVKYSRNYPAIGKFTNTEFDLIEKLVSQSASDYGFFGDKLITDINNKISKQHLIKISSAGQYLYKDQAHKLFNRIQNEIGERVMLTSGVRGLMKQLQLFTAKAVRTDGNLSRASRSLAPPGHSYHGIGDFDIGDIGLGKLNFTEKFSNTDVYKNLIELGFIRIRYDSNNKFGVRYEPWHIKVNYG